MPISIQPIAIQVANCFILIASLFPFFLSTVSSPPPREDTAPLPKQPSGNPALYRLAEK